MIPRRSPNYILSPNYTSHNLAIIPYKNNLKNDLKSSPKHSLKYRCFSLQTAVIFVS